MIVVDCSVVVDALVGVDSELWHERLAKQRLTAPSLLDYEFLSALRGLERGGRITTPRAIDALSDFGQLPVRRWDFSSPLRWRSFDLRSNLTAYDAAYVALAEALECPLLTRDSRLAKAAKDVVEVKLV